MSDHGDRIRASWTENADAWTDAVRARRIPSRRLGTDAAVLATCLRVLAASERPRALDVGCGEGWLARALAPHSAHVLGVDGSAELIAHARAASDEPNLSFEVATYEELRSTVRAPGPFDLVVANYALLD